MIHLIVSGRLKIGDKLFGGRNRFAEHLECADRIGLGEIGIHAMVTASAPMIAPMVSQLFKQHTVFLVPVLVPYD